MLSNHFCDKQASKLKSASNNSGDTTTEKAPNTASTNGNTDSVEASLILPTVARASKARTIPAESATVPCQFYDNDLSCRTRCQWDIIPGMLRPMVTLILCMEARLQCNVLSIIFLTTAIIMHPIFLVHTILLPLIIHHRSCTLAQSIKVKWQTLVLMNMDKLLVLFKSQLQFDCLDRFPRHICDPLLWQVHHHHCHHMAATWSSLLSVIGLMQRLVSRLSVWDFW